MEKLKKSCTARRGWRYYSNRKKPDLLSESMTFHD